MTPYASLSELKERQGWSGTEFDQVAQRNLEAASKAIRQHCGRDFSPVADGSEDVTARYYRPIGRWLCRIDDAWNGTDDTPISTIEIGSNGKTGTFTTYGGDSYPEGSTFEVTDRIRFDVDALSRDRGSLIKVTPAHTWGWKEIPEPIVEATLLWAIRLFKRKDSAEGFIAGGDGRLARASFSRLDDDVAQMIGGYKRGESFACTPA